MEIDWEYLENLIKPLLDKKDKLNNQYIKQNLNIVEELNSIEFLRLFPLITEKKFAIKNKLIEIPKCKCGNLLKFKNGTIGYGNYCSNKCLECINYNISKMKKGSMDKHGCLYPAQSKKVQDLIKQTNFKKYGVEFAGQIKEGQEKQKKTCLEKYGVEYALQNEQVKNKTKNTNIKLYGCENVNQNKKIRKKASIKFTNNFINNRLREKLNIIKELYNIVPHEWSLDEYININKKYAFIHIDCKKIFVRSLYNGKLPKCPKCHKLKGTSKIEIKLQDELTNIYGSDKIQCNNRELIKPYELDIIINNIIAVEVNGIYWHREGSRSTPVELKSKLCPIPLLHFTDIELIENFEKCLKIIETSYKNLLTKNNNFSILKL